MRKYAYLGFDVGAALLALVAALYLRNGVALIEEGRPYDVRIMLLICVGVSVLVLPLMRTHTRMWRFTSPADVSAVMIAAALIVLLTNGGLFLFNRLEIVPRSVPPVHWAIMAFIMCGSRISARWMYGGERSAAAKQQQHVLIVGANHATELYIEFAKKILSGQVVIEGILDEDTSLQGRLFHQFPVLGSPAEMDELLQQLRVHGIVISKVIVARAFDQLHPNTQQGLLALEQQGLFELIHFDRQIGIYQPLPELASTLSNPMQAPQFTIAPPRHYARIKRLLDCVAASLIIAATAPLLIIAAILVYCNVGMPILFWQKRPGLNGKPFKLFKFRTMRMAGRKHNEDRLTHKQGDKNRTTATGHLLRRLRFDELPQLFHILGGTMSFIGPRPLLPDDQPKGGEQRLMVRPGITGWAQVNGGDALTPEQKLILDLWYIQHMSLRLDCLIMLRTVVVLFQHDIPRLDVVDKALHDLNAFHATREDDSNLKH